MPRVTLFTSAEAHIYYVDSFMVSLTAMHETRTAYKVVDIELEPNLRNSTEIHELWFAGRHSDVGGGSRNADLSTLTLAWKAVSSVTKLFSKFILS